MEKWSETCLNTTVTRVVSLWWVWLFSAVVPTTVAVIACLFTACCCTYRRWRRVQIDSYSFTAGGAQLESAESETELRSESSLAVTSLIAPNRDGERSVPENCAERESRSHAVNEIDPATSCIVLEPFKGLGHRACSQADRHDHNRKGKLLTARALLENVQASHAPLKRREDQDKVPMRKMAVEKINAVRYAAVEPLVRSRSIKQPSRRQDIGRFVANVFVRILCDVRHAKRKAALKVAIASDSGRKEALLRVSRKGHKSEVMLNLVLLCGKSKEEIEAEFAANV